MTLNTFIADDNIYYLERLERIVNSFNEINLTGRARDGEEALKHINKEKPDLLILDVEMPNLNGLEVVNNLNYSPYVILCTGSFYHFDEIEEVEILLKPVLREEIEEKIKNMISKNRKKVHK